MGDGEQASPQSLRREAGSPAIVDQLVPHVEPEDFETGLASRGAMAHQARLRIDHQVVARVVGLLVAQRIDQERLLLRRFFGSLGVAAFDREATVLTDPAPLADIGLVAFDARRQQVRPFIGQPVVARMLQGLAVGVDPGLPLLVEK